MQILNKIRRIGGRDYIPFEWESWYKLVLILNENMAAKLNFDVRDNLRSQTLSNRNPIPKYGIYIS